MAKAKFLPTVRLQQIRTIQKPLDSDRTDNLHASIFKVIPGRPVIPAPASHVPAPFGTFFASRCPLPLFLPFLPRVARFP